MIKKLIAASAALALALYSPAWAATRMQMTGFGVASGGGTTTIFAPSAVPLNSDDSNATVSFRFIGLVTGNSGTKLRTTITPSSTLPLSATNVSACKWDGGPDSNCTTVPVELTVSGASGFSTAAGVSVTTDFVATSGTFSVAPGDSVIIIVDVSTNGGQRFRNSLTNSTTWFSNPGQVSWNVQTPGGALGFTAINNTDYMITSIETQ